MHQPHQSEPVKSTSSSFFSALALALAASKSVCHAPSSAAAGLASADGVFSSPGLASSFSAFSSSFSAASSSFSSDGLASLAGAFSCSLTSAGFVSATGAFWSTLTSAGADFTGGVFSAGGGFFSTRDVQPDSQRPATAHNAHTRTRRLVLNMTHTPQSKGGRETGWEGGGSLTTTLAHPQGNCQAMPTHKIHWRDEKPRTMPIPSVSMTPSLHIFLSKFSRRTCSPCCRRGFAVQTRRASTPAKQGALAVIFPTVMRNAAYDAFACV